MSAEPLQVEMLTNPVIFHLHTMELLIWNVKGMVITSIGVPPGHITLQEKATGEIAHQAARL